MPGSFARLIPVEVVETTTFRIKVQNAPAMMIGNIVENALRMDTMWRWV